MCSVSDDALPMPCKKREYVLINSAINVVIKCNLQCYSY